METHMPVTHPVDAALKRMPKIASTEIAKQMQDVNDKVSRHGAAVITKHDKPVMVMMTVDHYKKLAAGATPDLDALTREFDEMVAAMQGKDFSAKALAAFNASPTELGRAAVEGARRGRRPGRVKPAASPRKVASRSR
jgi:GTP1/Obg family GTP-binding protein